LAYKSDTSEALGSTTPKVSLEAQGDDTDRGHGTPGSPTRLACGDTTTPSGERLRGPWLEEVPMNGSLTEGQLRTVLADALEGAAQRVRNGSTIEGRERRDVVPEEEATVVAGTRLAFSINEAAESLGISRGTVYEAIRAGRFPALRLGRRQLIPVEGLRRWVAEQADPRRGSS
jgi:excisionase family DNA binding protein